MHFFLAGAGLFGCDVEGCGKTFRRNCELTRHKMNHSEEWPFVCEVSNCRRKFKRRDIFNNHLKTHKPEDESDFSQLPRINEKENTANSYSVVQPLANNSEQQGNEVWASSNWDQSSQPLSISIIPVQITTTAMSTSSFGGQAIGDSWTAQSVRMSSHESWGADATTNNQGWQAMTSQPALQIQGSWMNPVRSQPVEPTHEVITNPMLETLGLRPAVTITSTPGSMANRQWSQDSEALIEPQDVSMTQCRFTIDNDVQAAASDANNWNL